MPKALAYRVNQLTVNYGKTPVLWDINIEVPQGSIAGIIGPNGAGKSTLIKTSMQFIKPISGHIEFFEKPLKEVRDKIAYVPQKGTVDWNFPINVREIVLMGRYHKRGFFSRINKEDEDMADFYIEKVGLKNVEKRQINELSGGQQQRVFIARAMMQEAFIYFLDEPFSGIDITTEQLIMQIFKELAQEGKTILIIHHDLNTVSNYFNWLVMLNMYLIANGKTEDVFTGKNIAKTYGQNYNVFGEAYKLSYDKYFGIQ